MKSKYIVGYDSHIFKIKLDKKWFNNADLIKPIYSNNKILNFIYKFLKRKPKYYGTEG